MLAAGAASLSARTLPDHAASVIKANFPKAEITGVGRERERGAWYYEVNLRDGNRRFEVEITEEGVIGEIEAKVRFADMPPEIQSYVRRKVGAGRVRLVEKHERRGVARSGTFVPLKKTRIMYEVKYVTELGYREEIQVSSNGILELPVAVRRNIRSAYPKARIREAEAEDDDGILVFVVKLAQDQTAFHLSVLKDGRVIEKEEPITFEDLPAPLQRNLRRSDTFTNASVQALLRAETFAVVEDEDLVARHDITYVVRNRRGDEYMEYRFDGRGRLVKTLEAGEGEDDGDDEDDEDDD